MNTLLLTDITFIAGTIALFAAAALYAHFCESI